MDVREISWGDAQPIEGYGPDLVRIGGRVLHGPCLIHAGGAGPWGGIEDTAPLLALAGAADVVLLGTGSGLVFPSRALRELLEGAGIGLEPMTTPAACRTYNVLLAEGRRIAAALVPVGRE